MLNLAPMKQLALILICLPLLWSGSSFAMGKQPATGGATHELPTQATSVGAAGTSLFNFGGTKNDFLVYVTAAKELNSYRISTKSTQPISTSTDDSPANKTLFFSILPNNNQVVFTKGLRNNDNAQLFIANLDGGNLQQISQMAKQTFFTPRKLVAGNYLIYIERRDSSGYRLMRYNLANRNSEEVKPDDGKTWNVAYFNISSDGQELAFVAKNDTTQKLFYTDISENKPVAIDTPGLNPDSLDSESAYFYDQGESIRFTQNTQHIYFLSSRLSDGGAKSFQLFVYDKKTAKITALSDADDAFGIREYWISEKTKKVIYLTAKNATTTELWSIASDGTEKATRLHDKAEDGAIGVQSGSILLNDSAKLIYFQAALSNHSDRLTGFVASIDDHSNRTPIRTMGSADFMGTPLWSNKKDYIAVSTMQKDATRTDLFASNIFNGEQLPLNTPSSSNKDKVGSFRPTQQNQFIFTATEKRNKMDLFLVNLNDKSRTKLNHTLSAGDEVSAFSLSADQTWVAYTVRSDSGSNLWVRPITK